jgi:hypothetical protein
MCLVSSDLALLICTRANTKRSGFYCEQAVKLKNRFCFGVNLFKILHIFDVPSRQLFTTLLDLGDISNKVDDTVGVAPFIVVPTDEFNKALVQCNARLDVKDA